MHTPRTLCLLESEHDISWIEEYHRQRRQSEEITVAAYSLLGRIAAEKITVPCTVFDGPAWSLDNYGLSAVASRTALSWPEGIGRPDLERLFRFRDYPLALMHQPNLKRSLMYILPSLVLTRRIFETCRPDKVLAGRQGDRFANRDQAHAGLGPGGGFERECARELCRQRGIPFGAFQDGVLRRDDGVAAMPDGTGGDPDLAFVAGLEARDCLAEMAYTPSPGYRPQVSLPARGASRRMLFFAWGSYYLHDILPCLETLLERGCHIVVVIIGGDPAPEDLHAYSGRGVFFLRKEGFRLPDEPDIRRRLEGLYEQAGEALEASRNLELLFSDEAGPFYQGLAAKALRKEIGNMPNTVLELLRSEMILAAFAPDAVFAHFSVGATPGWGCYDVLPARRLGIPTLSMDHGVVGDLTAALAVSSCEYHATYGERQRQGQIIRCGFTPAKVRATGNPRLDAVSGMKDKKSAKLALGLDPERPVVVFCSTAELGGLYELPHSAYDTLQAMLRLKAALPGIQLIYRAHHGVDYRLLKDHFTALAIPGLSFECSLEPPHPVLTDLLQGTDVLISHAGSSLTEAAVHGVPAVYLCARSAVEPVFLLDGAFPLALSFEALPGLVRECLDRPFGLEEQRRAHIANVLRGSDGQAAGRIADFLLDIADMPRTKGWDDWTGRLRETSLGPVAVAAYGENELQRARAVTSSLQEAHASALSRREDAARRTAKEALAALARRYEPKTLLHMGSHRQPWLALAAGHGIAARSLEADAGGARKPAFLFEARDTQRADILVCSELLDQLPSGEARRFAAELARLSPVVIAACPLPGLPCKSVLDEAGWEAVRQAFADLGYALLDLGPAAEGLRVYAKEALGQARPDR